MTLTSETNRVQYSGDGSTTAFTITFVFWANADIQAVHTDSNGTETTWTLGTQFTLSGGSGSTGTLTVSTSPTDYTPASGTTLTITSNLDDTQPTSLPEGGVFPSASVEQQLDKIVRLIQQKAEALGRAIKLPISSANTDLAIPDPSASKFLRWNSGATALENADIASQGSIGVPVTVAEGGTNASTAAAARTNLDVFEDVFTTRGDLLRAGASGAEERVALGTSGYVLTSDGTDAAWATPPQPMIGLTLSNDTDTAHDINVTAGRAYDSANDEWIILTSEITKQIDASWALGDDAGGLDGTESVAGTPDATTTYYVHLIRRSDTGVVDALFSESEGSPTLPTNYDQSVLIGAVVTDGSANITNFIHRPGTDRFDLLVPTNQFQETNPGDTSELRTLTVPTSTRCRAILALMIEHGSTGEPSMLVTAPDQTDTAASTTVFTIKCHSGNANTTGSAVVDVTVNSSGQIRTDMLGSGASTEVTGVLHGWYFKRGSQ